MLLNKKDPIFNSYWVSKLISKVTRHGKKYISNKIIYGIFKYFKKENKNLIFIFFEALEYLRPIVVINKIKQKKFISKNDILFLNIKEQYFKSIQKLFINIKSNSGLTFSKKLGVILRLGFKVGV